MVQFSTHISDGNRCGSYGFGPLAGERQASSVVPSDGGRDDLVRREREAGGTPSQSTNFRECQTRGEVVVTAATSNSIKAGLPGDGKTMSTAPTAGEAQPLREGARAFLSAAIAALTESNVVPTSRWRSYIRVGKDYAGSEVMCLPEFDQFEAALKASYPHRLDRPLSDRSIENSNHYIFGLLEACVAEFAAFDEPYAANSSIVEEAIDDLVEALDAEDYELVCCRVVSHLTTTDGKSAVVGGVTIHPQLEPAGYSHPLTTIAKSIPGAGRAFDDGPPFAYDPPISILTVRATTSDDPLMVGGRLSGQLDRFLLLSRLIHGATGRSHWQIVGSSARVGRSSPTGDSFVRGSNGPQFIRREGRLATSQSQAFESLGHLLENAKIARGGKMFTSFDMALHRFTRSYTNDNLFDCVVDLATSMEAALLGGSGAREDIGLRLKSRAAALLATGEDPASKIFRDMTALYDVRSSLVHGGSLAEKDLIRYLRRLVPDYDKLSFGVALAKAVDRFRDLVRRAILARLALAADPDALWKLEEDPGVDAALADDSTRLIWRGRWRDSLARMGLEDATLPAGPAADWIAGL